MTLSRWVLSMGGVVAVGGLAGPVLAQFCVDPISPLCCPSPCPVVDPARLPKLLGDVETLGRAVGVDAQVVQTTSQIGQSIGDAKAAANAVAQQLTSFTGISSEVTAVQAKLSTNPVQALSDIKTSLFEPPMASSSASQMSSRLSARVAAAQGEQVAALATSLMRVQSIPASSPQRAQLATAASNTQQLQGDLAVNSTTRLAIYQDIGTLHQLVSAWVAQRSMQAALAHPVIGAGGPASTTALAATASPIISSSENAVGVLDQLITLHDARAAAQAVVSAYPALQQTIASANLASQFNRDAEAALRQSLSDAGLSGAATAPGIENALKAADATDWLDSAKTTAASQAVSKVTAMMVESGKIPPAAVDGNAAFSQVQAAMIGWLDADKQSRYWTALAAQAQQSISALDANLGALSDEARVDVTGSGGAAREKALLIKLSHDPAAAQWQPLLNAAANDISAKSILSYSATR